MERRIVTSCGNAKAESEAAATSSRLPRSADRRVADFDRGHPTDVVVYSGKRFAVVQAERANAAYAGESGAVAGGHRLRLFGVGGAVREEERGDSQRAAERLEEELRQRREKRGDGVDERSQRASRPERQIRAGLLCIAMRHSHQLSDAGNRLVPQDRRAQSATEVLSRLREVRRFEVNYFIASDATASHVLTF